MTCRCGKKFKYTGKTVNCPDCWNEYRKQIDEQFKKFFPEVAETMNEKKPIV